MSFNVIDPNGMPPTVPAAYFLFLPISSKLLWANNLNDWGTPTTFYGNIESWVSSMNNAPLIPIDPHLALSLNWLTIDEMVMDMPYVNDHVKAALKLIKDIKEEEHGNDKEGED